MLRTEYGGCRLSGWTWVFANKELLFWKTQHWNQCGCSQPGNESERKEGHTAGIVLKDFRLRDQGWGSVISANIHSEEAGKQRRQWACVWREKLCSVRNRKVIQGKHSDKPARLISQRPIWPGWLYSRSLAFGIHKLHFFGAYWQRQECSPLQLFQDNEQVTLEGMGMPPDILAYHVGPVWVVLLIGQDRYNDL